LSSFVKPQAAAVRQDRAHSRDISPGVRLKDIIVLGCAVTALVASAFADEPVPSVLAQAPASTTASSGAKPAPKKPAAPEKLVDINNASVEELKKELNINDEVANKIVAARPLLSKTQLVTKVGLPEGTYLSLRHKIAINDMKKPAAKKTEPKKAAATPDPKSPEPKK
jgi:DNA uptake protein ComE-like DNA-binding protein